MRATVVMMAIALCCATGAGAAERTLVGTISDSMCGVDHKKMATNLADRDCTLACTSKGMSYVLLSDGKVYKLTSHESDLKAHAGHVVTVTGDLKGDSIRVSKIEMPKS